MVSSGKCASDRRGRSCLSLFYENYIVSDIYRNYIVTVNKKMILKKEF